MKTKTVEIVTVVEDVVSDFRPEWDLDMTEDGALFESDSNGSQPWRKPPDIDGSGAPGLCDQKSPGCQDSGVCRYLAPRDIRCQGVFYRTPLLSLLRMLIAPWNLKRGR